MGISGFVSNIDLFSCALQVFRHNDFVIRTSSLKFISSESRYSNRLLTLFSHWAKALFHKYDRFDSLLGDRIDILSIRAKIGYADEREMQLSAFFDSLERLHDSLNNLEEHLHADTNSYLVVGFDLVVPNKYFIIPTILASSSLLFFAAWKTLQSEEGLEFSFFFSCQIFLFAFTAFALQKTIEMNFYIILLLKISFYLLVCLFAQLKLACIFFGVFGLLLTFSKVDESLFTLLIPLFLLPRCISQMNFTEEGSNSKD